MRRSPAVALAGMLGLAGMLAGCADGGGTAEPASSAPSAVAEATAPAGTLPDPCELLSAADIEAASGVAFGEGMLVEDVAAEDRASCVWNAVDSPLPIVQVLVVAGADLAASQRESAEEWMGESADVDVAGATDAYEVGQGTILGMQVGDLFVEVSFMSADEGDLTDTTVAIAELAIASM
ncbi:DUF3558 family protein [Demequina rhizosphaerae]|uniref:DUF3558 family protein n=1 Tax=Demequina rhizosphaerae TaxID=1638985 RepID=UPI000A07D68D|nr:DUF3558 family protein [Demequina rhizosphaerae]